MRFSSVKSKLPALGAALVVLFAFVAPLARADNASPTTRPATRPTVVSAAPATQPATRPATPSAGFDPVATPKSVTELHAIETQVQAAVKRALPAVVGVRMRSGQGSGVIITPDGYVLTAGHVTGEAGLDCTLILADGRTIKGKTLGVNKEMDSGLIKISDEGPWPFVGMGKAESLKQGQWCIAMGHPNGYRRDRPPVVRLGRVLLNASNMVMTDCTLVGGDSGGPLFDLEGNVIGINSRIGNPTSANMHVPVDTFVDTWERLADGEVWGLRTQQPQRAGGPALGIIGLDLPEGKGCRVERVDKNSPAEKAGIIADDTITSFDGKIIVGLDPLVELIGKKKVGDEVEVELLRDGKTMTVKVKLAARP